MAINGLKVAQHRQKIARNGQKLPKMVEKWTKFGFSTRIWSRGLKSRFWLKMAKNWQFLAQKMTLWPPSTLEMAQSVLKSSNIPLFCLEMSKIAKF